MANLANMPARDEVQESFSKFLRIPFFSEGPDALLYIAQNCISCREGRAKTRTAPSKSARSPRHADINHFNSPQITSPASRSSENGGPSPDDSSRRTHRFPRADEIIPAKIQWFWEPLIPYGDLTVLDGLPDMGKSTIVYSLAAAVSSGNPLPSGATKSASQGVVLIEAEDTLDTVVVPRLDAAGADRSKMIICGDWRLPDDLKELEDAVDDLAARFVCINPMEKVFQPSLTNRKKVAELLSALRALARQKDIAILLVNHWTKQASGPAIYRGAGSQVIASTVRSILQVENDPAGRQHHFLLKHAKRNLASAPPQPFRTVMRNGVIMIEWLPIVVPRGLRSGTARPRKSRTEEAVEFLLIELGDGPLPSKEINRRSDEAGISRRTLRRAREELGIQPTRRDIDDGSYWWEWELPRRQPGDCEKLMSQLSELFLAATVKSTGGSPEVINDGTSLHVIKYHEDRSPNIHLRFEEWNRLLLFVASHGDDRVEFELADPKMLDKLRPAMETFNLVWRNEDYERLSR